MSIYVDFITILICVLNSGRAGEPAHEFNTDDGVFTREGNPVSPVFFLVFGFEFHIAKGDHDLGDARWWIHIRDV